MVEWAPIDVMGNPQCAIGVLRDGAWVVDTADGLAPLDNDRSLVFVFPLMNESLNTLRDQIRSSLDRSSLDVTNVHGFPFSRIVTCAIDGGGFWAEKSFNWLNAIQLGDSERASAIEGLKHIESDKRCEQKLRHLARRHRTRLESV
jgi:hypothetical protein